MTTRRTVYSGLLALAAYCAMPFYAAATTIVIDNFDSDTLDPEWNYTAVLFQAGATATPNYNTVTNPDKLTYSYTGANGNAIQTSLLRDDHVLATDGDYLEVTASIPSVTGASTFNLFGGLMIDSGSETPANRSNMTTIVLAANRRIFAQQNDVQTNSVSDAFTLGSEVVLRITRVTGTSVSLSYSTNAGATFATLGGDGFTYNVTGFNALGFYNGNARSSATGVVTYDNLTMITVPEPSALLLASLGLTVVAVRIRKRTPAASR